MPQQEDKPGREHGRDGRCTEGNEHEAATLPFCCLPAILTAGETVSQAGGPVLGPAATIAGERSVVPRPGAGRSIAGLVPYFKIADPEADRMNTEPAPALDDLLNQARSLLLDFDGAPAAGDRRGLAAAAAVIPSQALAPGLRARCGSPG